MVLRPGLAGTVTRVVDRGMTAAAVGSGLAAGLATPVMIGLMEGAAVEAVQPCLAEGLSTVGTRVEVEHLAPTPVGMQVTARATLDVVDGRRLVFSVTAEDEVGLVGRGTHERFIVDRDGFARRLATRGSRQS